MTMLSDGMLLGVGGGYTPPLFVSSTNNWNTAAGIPVVVDKPVGVAAGDIMTAIVTSTSGSGDPSASGWTLEYSSISFMAILSKIAGGSEPSSYTFTPYGGSYITVAVLVHRGGFGIFDQVGSLSYRSSDPTIATSMLTDDAGTLIAAFCRNSNADPSSAPSGMTQRVATSAAGGIASVAAYELSPSPAGATGNKSMSWVQSGSQDRWGIQYQIR